ncbi:hypothetical protein CsatB_025841 [Cannabis sativa]
MHVAIQEHTNFEVHKGVYCYLVMPFGLKNVKATYKVSGESMFKDVLEKNIEVYVDDILVMSKTSREHGSDLGEAFSIIQKYGLKLNPKKCTFRVSSRKFSCFIVSSHEIKANPERIGALLDMPSSKIHIRLIFRLLFS